MADGVGVGLPELPVQEILAPLREALREPGSRAVVVAPPGAGKTTIVPLVLAREPWAEGRIVVLEPRRLATRAAARRMAELHGDAVGGHVGYRTRDERRVGSATRVEVVTEGILTRRLQSDPDLPGVSAVIFDEVHERNLQTDLGLALALDAAATLRPDLRIVAMSATPDVAGLRRVLGDDVNVLESEGQAFPVDVRWQPRGNRERIEPATVAAVQRALREERGDVLVFLPGIGEIRRVQEQLDAVVSDDVDVHPLAGALSLADQDVALAPSPPGRRRVVLATDIAETSLTVEGVRVVVDSGLARAPRFDTGTGMTRLDTISTSRASADQRAGRAGRLEPGVCYRLWSKLEHGSRQAHRTPEIRDADLAGFALEVAAWGTPIDELELIDAPTAKTWRSADELLTELGALADGQITAEGRSMLHLPVHPRLGRMVTRAPTPLSCVLAVLVEERDVLRGRRDELPVDLALRVELVMGLDRHPAADRHALARLRERAADLARRAGVTFDVSSIDPQRSGATLLLAYPDRLAARRRPGQFQLRTGKGAWIPDTDPLAHEAFVVAADLDGRRDRARIRLAAGLEADDVAVAFGDRLATSSRLEWDPDRDDLVERTERRLDSIRLGERIGPARPGEPTTAALLARARATRLAVLGWNRSSISLRSRVEFLHRRLGEPWPDWSIDALTDRLDEWLTPYLPGATGRDDLESLDVGMVLRSQLPWPDGARLDELAPAALELPSGRSVPIDYGGDAPTAAVRVQDLFGVTEHPMAGGHPIVLELLSPADRPIQVTADLPRFWSGSWREVRKEMAGRYPKHHWPDDPAIATPKRLKDR